MKWIQKRNKLFFAMSIAVFSVLMVPGQVLAQGLWDGWSGDVFVGYNQTRGNTEKASASITAHAMKKFDTARFNLKGSLFYSESDKKMDGQKWDALAKYSLDFGKDSRWFSFYQVYADHDYFADIDYRITPVAGIGYRISQTEDWTWDVDAGLGYRITRHRVNTGADDEALTALVHTFMKKRVFGNAFISEDLTVYPGLKADAGVVLKSETAFTNPLNERLDLEIKYIVDYNSEPALDKKKTDTQMIVGMKYKF